MQFLLYRKRASSLGVVLVLLLASTQPLFASPSTEMAAEEKPVIQLMVGPTRIPLAADTYIIQDIGKRMNATVEPINGDKKMLQTLIASRQVPDLMYGNAIMSRLEALDYGPQGVLFPLDTKFDIMPNINRLRTEYKEWDAAMTANDGHQYVTPWVSEFPYFFYAPLISPKVRDYGIDPRTDIETFDDLYEIFKMFKNDNPDSYPWVTRRGLRTHLYIFGTDRSFYLNRFEDRYVFGPMEETYRLMVEFMAKNYAEGLMHPDWFTMSEDPWRENMAAGKSLFTVDQFRQKTSLGGTPEDESSWWISFIVPKFHGTRYYTTDDYTHVNESIWKLSADTEHVDRILPFVDWQYTEEASVWTMFGNIGETAERTDDGVRFLDIPEGSDAGTWAQEQGMVVFRGALQTRAVFFNRARIKQAGGNLLALDLWEADIDYVEGSGTVRAAHPILTFADDEFDSIKQLQTDIETYANENVIQFVTGQRPLTEWDDYVNELKKLGVEEVIEIYSAAYDRYAKLVQ